MPDILTLERLQRGMYRDDPRSAGRPSADAVRHLTRDMLVAHRAKT